MLRITGGKVYDPANGVNGEVRDVCIADGKIVADVRRRPHHRRDRAWSSSPAAWMSTRTSPGRRSNFARGLIPEHHRKATPIFHTPARRGRHRRHHAHHLRHRLPLRRAWATPPSTRPPCPILSAKHTHEELRDTPIVDKACCVLMANNEIVLDLLENGEYERAKHVVAWHIWAAKAYGVKAVNPGGVAAWKWGKDAKGLARAGARLQAR